MPDWRNPADYEYTADLTLHGWAWEFLRRNPEYRERWRQISAKGSNPLDPNTVPDRIALGADYGLWFAADPNLGFFHAQPQWRIGTAVRFLSSYAVQGEHWPERVALVFNLLEDLAPQLQHAKALLTSLESQLLAGTERTPYRPTSKPHPRKYPAYIRALDGHEAGVPHVEIGKTLFPEPEPGTTADAIRAVERERKNAANAIRAAKRLSAGGYRDLLYRPNL